MAFISYAQNYEDVILWRALHDVEKGFYVDVGAADPTELSVTRAFYDRGWSGINVEPLDEYFDKLKQARPRDTNLKIAAGRDAGARTLHTIAGTGLSTFDAHLASKHQVDGRKATETVVPVLPLAKILEDCAPPIIHFLKIDVEGTEMEVLEGLNLGRVRPWIVLIEATEPNSKVTESIEPFSTVSTRDKWEHLITGRGYEFAYFDGLNCFYVANEMVGLKERLAVPPNVFDGFVQRQDWSNRQKAAALEQELAGRKAALQIEQEHAADLRKALQTEQNHAADLGRALQIEQVALQREQNHAADLRKALQIEQSDGASLRESLQAVIEALRIERKALQTEQDRTRQLSEYSRQLEIELVTPALKRALRRLRDAGNKLTGGGIRALAKRTLQASLHRALGHPRLVAIGRGALKPFPALLTKLQRLAWRRSSSSCSAGSSFFAEIGESQDTKLSIVSEPDAGEPALAGSDVRKRDLRRDASPEGCQENRTDSASWSLGRSSPGADAPVRPVQATTTDTTVVSASVPPFGGATTPAALPASARRAYIKLQTAISDNDDWSCA